MKRPALTAIASALAAVLAAVTILATTGGISSATALSVQSSAPAPASQTDHIAPPAPVAIIEPKAESAPITTEPDAGAKEPARPPLLTSDPPGPEKSARPTRADWKNAPLITLARASDDRCKARRIREWLLLKCDIPNVTGFSMIAGTREGVDFWMNTGELSPSSITFEFPLRRGDRRVFQIDAMAGKYGSSPEAIISERWSDGDTAPLVTIASAI